MFLFFYFYSFSFNALVLLFVILVNSNTLVFILVITYFSTSLCCLTRLAPMKGFTIKSHDLLLSLLFAGWFLLCSGQTDTSVAPMEKKEQEALYSAIQGFVGKWWNGSDLYPDPCGWTPIQVLSH